MFGFDTDTPDVFEKTLKTIKELQIDVADFSILTPFPGTPLFTKLDAEKRILTKDWKYYNMGHVVFSPKQMTPDELLQGVRLMYADYYHPLNTIKRIVQNLTRGLYPFFVVVARNVVATLSARRLYTVKKR